MPTICISVAFRSSQDRLTQGNFTEQRLKHEYDTSRDRLTQRNFTEQRLKHEYDTRKTKTKTKTKWTKNRFLYYANSTGTRQLQLLSGDISQNPGPCLTSGNGGQKKQHHPAPKCSTCEKTVAQNHRRLLCIECRELCHVNCTNLCITTLKQIKSNTPYSWICQTCQLAALPFYDVCYESLLENQTSGAKNEQDISGAIPENEQLEAERRNGKEILLSSEHKQHSEQV